jgi:Cu/Ag efflux protein CusF
LPPIDVAELSVEVTSSTAGAITGISAVEAALKTFGRMDATATLFVKKSETFAKTIADSQAELKAFAGKTYESLLGAARTRTFDSVIAKAKLELAAITRDAYNAKLGVNAAPLFAELSALNRALHNLPSLKIDDTGAMATIATVRLALANFEAQVYKAKIGADAGPLLREIAAIKAMFPLNEKANIKGDIADALAKITTLEGALASLKTEHMTMTMTVDDTAALASIAAVSTAASAAGDKQKGSALWGSLGALLGIGGGAGIGGIRGLGALGALPKFGTLGSLGGLGAEHILTTVAGLLGNLGGAILGGGLLAATGASVAAVGMGTDLAGIGQAAGDIQKVVTAQNNLATAVATYGKNSSEAKTAQSQLNQALSSFNPIAKQAVQHSADLAQNLKKVFDQATGLAEKRGARIIGEAITAANPFVPVIGTFSQQNMLIMENQLKPFFAWLDSKKASGGLTIFTDLEKVFQKNLNPGTNTIIQVFELFAKTVDHIATSGVFGKVMTQIDNFFIKWNKPTETPKWFAEVDSLIKDFKNWVSLFSQLGQAIYNFFNAGKSSKTSTDIVVTLTKDLKDLNDWLTSKAGKADIATLFTAHKGEIDAVLNLLKSLVTGVGGTFIAAAPAVTTFFTALLQGLNWIAKISPQVAAAMGWLIILQHLGALTSAEKVIGKFILNALNPLATKAGTAALKMLGLDAAATTLGEAGWAGLGKSILAVAGPIGVIAGAITLVLLNKDKINKALGQFIPPPSKGEPEWAKWVADIDKVLGTATSIAVGGVAMGGGAIATTAKSIWGWMTNPPGQKEITAAFNSAVTEYKAAVGKFASQFVGGGEKIAKDVWGGITNPPGQKAVYAAFNTAYNFVKNGINDLAGKLGGGAVNVGKDIWGFITNPPGQKGASNFASNAGNDIANAFKNVLGGAGSLKTQFQQFGKNVTNWVGDGIGSVGSVLSKAASDLANSAVSFFQQFVGGAGSFKTQFEQFGKNVTGWVSSGIGAAFSTVATGIHNVVNSAVTTMRTAVSGAAKALKSIGNDVINSLNDGIQATWNTVKTWLGNLGTWIKNQINSFNPITLLVSAGNNIVQGLINGMSAMLPNLLKEAGNLITSLPSKVAKVLGLGSPSTLFHQYGVWTIQGLINGLQSQQSQLSDQAAVLGTSMKTSFNRSLGTGLASSALGRGSNTVNLGGVHVTVNGSTQPGAVGNAVLAAGQSTSQDLLSVLRRNYPV